MKRISSIALFVVLLFSLCTMKVVADVPPLFQCTTEWAVDGNEYMRQHPEKSFFFKAMDAVPGWFFTFSYPQQNLSSALVNRSHYIILSLWKDEQHTKPLTFSYFKHNLWIGGYSENPNDMVTGCNYIAYPHQGFKEWCLFVPRVAIDYWGKDGIKPTVDNHVCKGYYTMQLSNDGKTPIRNGADAWGWLSIEKSPQQYVEVQDLGMIDLDEEEEECLDIVDLSLKLIETQTYPDADPILKEHHFTKCSSKGYHLEPHFVAMYNRGVEMQRGRAMAPQAFWATVSYSDCTFDDNTFLHLNMIDRLPEYAPKTKAIEFWMTEDATKHVCDFKQALTAHGFKLLKKDVGTWFYVNDKYVMYVMEYAGMSLTVLERKEKPCFDLLAMAADMLSGAPDDYLDKILKKYHFDNCTHLPEDPWSHGHWGERHVEWGKPNFGDNGYLLCFEDNTKIRIHGYDDNSNAIENHGWGFAKPAYFVFRINKGYKGFQHLCNFPGAGYRKVKEFTDVYQDHEPRTTYHVVEYTNDVLTFQTVNDGGEHYNVIVTRAGKEVKPVELVVPQQPNNPTPDDNPPSDPGDNYKYVFIPGGKEPHKGDPENKDEQQATHDKEKPKQRQPDDNKLENPSDGDIGNPRTQDDEPVVIVDTKKDSIVSIIFELDDLFDSPTLQEALKRANEKGFDDVTSLSDVFFSATRHGKDGSVVTIGCSGMPENPIETITITSDKLSETAIKGKLKEQGFNVDHPVIEERTMDGKTYVVITFGRSSDGEKAVIVKAKDGSTDEITVSLKRGNKRQTVPTSRDRALSNRSHIAAADTIFFCNFNDLTEQGWIANGPNCDGYATANGQGLDGTPSLQLRTKANANDFDAMAARAIGMKLPTPSYYVIRFHARAKRKGGNIHVVFSPFVDQEFEVGTEWTKCEVTFKIDKDNSKQDDAVFLYFGVSQNTYDIDDILLLKQ